MMKYDKLFRLLDDRGMTETDLLKVLPASTIRRLKENKNVSTRTIEKVCNYLRCPLTDVMEYVPGTPERR